MPIASAKLGSPGADPIVLHSAVKMGGEGGEALPWVIWESCSR